MAGTGWCTHPKRQLSSDVRILVRPAELACRNSWGNDFWEDKDSASDSTPVEPRREAEEPLPSQLSNLETSFEDEVTSVVSSESHRSRASEDLNDRVVEHTILPDDDFGAGDREQDERIDLLARDSRSAIKRAQERHAVRRNPESTSHDEAEVGNETIPVKPSFKPDDFVEQETPSREKDSDESGHSSDDDDVIISQGASVTSPRSRRIRRAREKSSTSKRDPLPDPERSGTSDQNRAQAVPTRDAPVERDRFNSIPDISADFELPRLRRSTQSVDDVRPVTLQSEEPEPPEMANSYDVALKQAHAIKAAAKAERQERLTHERRPLAPLRLERKEQERTPVERSVSAPQERSDVASVRIDAEAEDDLPASTPSRFDRGEPVIRERRRSVPVSTGRSQQAQFDADVFELDAEPTDFNSREEFDDGISSERETFASEPYPGYAEDDYLARRGIRMRRLPEPEAPSRTPEARKNWWRGIFQGRSSVEAPQQAEPEHETTAYSDVEPWLDEPEELTDVYTATYRNNASTSENEAVWDDVTGAHENDWAESGNEPEADYLIAQSGDDFPIEDEARSGYEPLDLADERDMNAFRDRLFASAPVEPAQRTQRFVARAPEQRPPISLSRSRLPDNERPARHAEPIEPVSLLDDPSDAWYEPETESGFDIRSLAAHESGLLDMTIEVSPDIPRNCATCRSYRVSEQGGRGWCTNTWAFTHRQMVNAEDLPCQSTIGCWWLPADEEVWLDDAEVVRTETPRVDRLIAHLDPLKRAVGR